MFVTDVCFLFSIELRWPKNKSICDNLDKLCPARRIWQGGDWKRRASVAPNKIHKWEWKRNSEAYQIFVSEGFISVFGFAGFFFCGFSVSNWPLRPYLLLR